MQNVLGLRRGEFGSKVHILSRTLWVPLQQLSIRSYYRGQKEDILGPNVIHEPSHSIVMIKFLFGKQKFSQFEPQFRIFRHTGIW